jgi:hypothetical protein
VAVAEAARLPQLLASLNIIHVFERKEPQVAVYSI